MAYLYNFLRWVTALAGLLTLTACALYSAGCIKPAAVMAAVGFNSLVLIAFGLSALMIFFLARNAR